MTATLPPWDQSRTSGAAMCACGHLVLLHLRTRGECYAIVRYSSGKRCQCKGPR